jgi:hypothetical protein
MRARAYLGPVPARARSGRGATHQPPRPSGDPATNRPLRAKPPAQANRRPRAKAQAAGQSAGGCGSKPYVVGAMMIGVRVGLRLPPRGSSVTSTLLTPLSYPETPTEPSPRWVTENSTSVGSGACVPRSSHTS